MDDYYYDPFGHRRDCRRDEIATIDEFEDSCQLIW